MNVRSFSYEGFESKVGSIALEAFDMATPLNIPVGQPAPLPIFTTEEIELAKTLAREEGLRDGQELTKNQYDAERSSIAALDKVAVTKLQQQINANLERLVEESQHNKLKFSEKLSSLALSIAQKVCGDVSAAIIEQQISAIIKESVARLDTTDKIKIHLNAKNAAELSDKFVGAMISVDEKMELGDFRIEWQNGYAERDVKKLWQAVSEICSRHSSLEENEELDKNEQIIKKGE